VDILLIKVKAPLLIPAQKGGPHPITLKVASILKEGEWQSCLIQDLRGVISAGFGGALLG
jgi:hypothetical protein